jgi:hypothetical protein
MSADQIDEAGIFALKTGAQIDDSGVGHGAEKLAAGRSEGG